MAHQTVYAEDFSRLTREAVSQRSTWNIAARALLKIGEELRTRDQSCHALEGLPVSLRGAAQDIGLERVCRPRPWSHNRHFGPGQSVPRGTKAPRKADSAMFHVEQSHNLAYHRHARSS
jgi:hypothetical protein